MIVEDELGHAFGNAVEAEGLHQGDEVADLASEMVNDHFRYGGAPVHHPPEGFGRDQPAFRIPMGLRAGSGRSAIKDLHLTHAGAWLQDVQDLDLPASIRTKDLQRPLDHHENARDVFPLVEDCHAIRIPSEFADPGKFLGFSLRESG